MTTHMEVLLIATGFTGAYTLRWLFGLVFGGSSAVQPIFAAPSACGDIVVQEVSKARREVQVLACGFAHRAVAQALIDAKLRGITVEVVLDQGNETDPTSEMPFLVEQGLAPWLGDDRPILQNAVVIDEQTVLAGNFTFSSGDDDMAQQNLLVLRGDARVAEAFRKRIQAHKEGGRQVPGSLTVETPVVPTSTQAPEPEPEPEPMLGPRVLMMPQVAVAPPMEEEEADPVSEGPMVTPAAAELFARLRRELAETSEQEPAFRPKKKAG
ncbi:MAG: hypothetical protein U0840_29505 [Gemmataceae bacterium]